MPAKSGLSHAVAAFISIVLGTTLSSVINAHTDLITQLSEGIGDVVSTATGISLHEEVAGLLLISTVLAFGWGVAYHYARHGSAVGGAKNYMSDRQSSVQDQDMSRLARQTPQDGTESTPADHGRYGTPPSARQTDRRLWKELSTKLAEAKSRLASAHDDTHEEVSRDMSADIRGLRKKISTLERKVERLEEQSPAGLVDASAVGEETRQQLRTTHEQIETLATKLSATAGSVPEADERAEQIVECQRLLQELEQAIRERSTALQQTGDTMSNTNPTGASGRKEARGGKRGDTDG